MPTTSTRAIATNLAWGGVAVADPIFSYVIGYHTCIAVTVSILSVLVCVLVVTIMVPRSSFESFTSSVEGIRETVDGGQSIQVLVAHGKSSLRGFSSRDGSYRMSAFIYVPGLSRPDTPGATPKAKVEAFKDTYLTGVVAKLEELYTAKIIDCGKQLRWVPVGEHKKAWELLGTPRDNMLSRVAGLAASPPPDMTPYELREFDASPPVPKSMFLAFFGNVQGRAAR
jgi:hypothetical protein